MTPDRSHSDTVGRVANKVRVEWGAHPTLTSTFRNIPLLTLFLRQIFSSISEVAAGRIRIFAGKN